jgi:uncharacterized protein involved in exopolysaccharide biosynthesis
MSTPTLKDIVSILFRRKTIILCFFLGTVSTVVIFAKMTNQRLYAANTQILLEVGREYISDLQITATENVGQTISFRADEQTALAIRLLTGRVLAEQVVKTLGPTNIYKDLALPSQLPLTTRVLQFLNLAEKQTNQKPRPLLELATSRVQSNVVARSGQKSSIIDIQFVHNNPRIAAQVLNTLVELYLKRHLSIHTDSRLSEFFEDQFGSLQEKLQKSQEALKIFKQQHGISSDFAKEKDLLISRKLQMEADLNSSSTQEAELENRVQQLKKKLANTYDDPDAVKALRTRLLELELEESDLIANYGSQSRILTNLREEMSAVKSKLAKLGDKRYGGTVADGISLYDNLQQNLLNYEIELNALRARQTNLLAQLNQYTEKLQDFDHYEAEFNHLQQQVDINLKNYNFFLTKLEERRIVDSMGTENSASIKVLEPATPPSAPLPNKTSLKILIGIFLGAIGGIGIAFLLEILNDTLDKKDDVENYLGLPVLGAVREGANGSPLAQNKV